MGKKYSINSTGYIVAERDIYSLGGFIPKGSVGAKVADETQISQEGECWVSSGDMSGRPDVHVKDNTYIGAWNASDFLIHTDVITEFSGNTLIPGKFLSRCPTSVIKNNLFVKDSFIGISMDVLCGPEATTTAFPFGQGSYNQGATKGTLFENMVITPIPTDACRSFADFRAGKDSYVYVPTGLTCLVLWGYWNTGGKIAYSGEYERISSGLTKLSHPVYNIARIVFGKSGGLTPADLLATGAKILGHISGSLLMDLRPESVSGEYVMDNSSFVMNTDNFGLNTTQLRFLAGGLFNTNMYTLTNRQDYKPYGTFRNVERLEYTKYLGDSHRTNVNRDKYVSGYDCPLLRVDDDTYDTSLTATGDLTLRRCIVPKGSFVDDPINGNTYEDIDFSYANEEAGSTIAGYAAIKSSHKQGLYRLTSGSVTNGLVSRSANLVGTGRLFPDLENTPLDGNIIEQGTYTITSGQFYEEGKLDSKIRLRTGRPVPTYGLVFPSLSGGFSIKALYYYNEDLTYNRSVTNPTSIDTVYPYCTMTFSKSDAAIAPNDIIALGLSLRNYNYHKVPEITGSAFVGAGCTIRGDVQLQGDPYVNRVFDINEWERGTVGTVEGNTYEDSKVQSNTGNRFRFKDTVAADSSEFTLTCNNGYFISVYLFDHAGIYMASSGWLTTYTVPAKSGAYSLAIVLKKATSVSDTGTLIDYSDIPLAGIKYVRAFKKRRYITNELDRKSPEDILLADYYWEQGAFYTDTGRVGRPYNDIKYAQSDRLRLSKPLPAGNATLTVANYWEYAMAKFDAGTKLLESSSEGYSMVSMTLRKAPPVTVNPSDAKDARLVITCTPQPRIVLPYGASGISINGMRIRMYDNTVLSKNINTPEELILRGDAVVGHLPDGCVCVWGDYDATIKL